VIETNDRQLITQMISSLTRENERLVEQLIQLVYYFRGAYSRNDVFSMSPGERELSIEFINKRFKEAGELMKHKIQTFL
jgi:hypothetical protein